MTESDLRSATPADLAGVVFSCSCGRRHAVGIGRIAVRPDAAAAVAEVLAERAAGRTVLVVADRPTLEPAGRQAAAALRAAGSDAALLVFDRPSCLVPDERALGEIAAALPRGGGPILAAGSGSVNDLCRFVADRSGRDYAVLASAPSMDGYASTVSPLILAGRKTTLEAGYPAAVGADPAALAAAPARLRRSGFGDLLGKATALADWELARRLEGEYYCPALAALVRRAMDASLARAEALDAGDADAAVALFDALLLSGLAMGMAGNSRPASGAEHHMAHYWEMDALAAGREHPLHGESVGAATVVIARLYELAAGAAGAARLPDGFAPPEAAALAASLRAAGAAASPAELGIGRELFRRSLSEARHVRPRYTILSHLAAADRLEAFADAVAAEFYPA